MLRQISKRLLHTPSKRFVSTTSVLLHRVTVIGAAGGIGKVLSLLIKTNPLVSDLVLMDIKNTAGIAADLSHIDTLSGVISFTGNGNLEKSLKCSNLVIVAAGIPRTEKTSSEMLFDLNKDIIYNVTSLKAKICPEAFLVIITNPLNALIPLAAETLKQANAYDKKKLYGISKTDTVRARCFIGDYLIIDPAKVNVNVIGGHSENTIVPVLSTARPSLPDDLEELETIYQHVRKSSTAVVREGNHSAQLCIAYAASTFCNSLLAAMSGKSGIVDVAYVPYESKDFPELKFFSSKFVLNKEGIKKFHSLPEMNNYERDLLQKAIPELKESIEKGIKYAQNKKDQSKKNCKTLE